MFQEKQQLGTLVSSHTAGGRAEAGRKLCCMHLQLGERPALIALQGPHAKQGALPPPCKQVHD